MKIPENCSSASVRAWCAAGSAGGRQLKRLVKVSQTFVAVACVGVFFNAGVSSAAQNLCVNPSNTPHCYATIQDAVDHAKSNAVMTVVAGTFHENVAINTGASPKNLSLVIQGAGIGNTIVDGGALDSVFNVGPKATLTLSKMTIQHGERSGSQELGGGVRSLATKTTIENCLVTDNSVPDGGGGGVGVEAGSLTISNSTLSDNSALGGGGGLFFATTTSKTATITNSTISGNTGNEGAGITVGALSKATIRNSTISGNIATEDDGSPPIGGGIFVDGKALTILDSTISGNLAQTGLANPSRGGGIYSLEATVTLNNVTIADNTASNGGGIYTIETEPGKSFSSSNSIIADNTGALSAPDCAGDLDSSGYNLILETTGCTISGKASTDILGMDPMLLPLTLNSPGLTETQALQAGSPALKAGNPGTPNGKGGHCLPTDQRGVKRTTGKCDIGAFQLSS